MKWLITGGSGFTGMHLLLTIQQQFPEDEILICDIKSPIIKLNEKVKYKAVDLLDEKQVVKILINSNPDRIMHLAGLMYDENPLLMTKVNVITCGILLEIIHSCKLTIDGILVVGSVAQYGKTDPKNPPSEKDCCIPSSFYGYLKLLQEKLALKYIKDYNLPIICVRPANIIGPFMPSSFLIPSILEQLIDSKRNLKSRTIRLKHTKAARDFIDVRDITKAYVSLLEHPKTRGEIFNIGCNRAISIEEIIENIKQILSIDILKIEEENPKKEFDFHLTNSLKIQSFIQWKPSISLKTTLEDMIKNFTT